MLRDPAMDRRLRSVVITLRVMFVMRSMTTTLVAIALMMITGCGRTLPETAPVEGRVTLDGKPLTTGAIMFFPEEGRPATGVIDADGSFRLTTFTAYDGALPGRHTVTIEADEVVQVAAPRSYEEEIQQGQQGARPTIGKLRYIVPAKYGNRATSGLTAEVIAQPEINRIDFNISIKSHDAF